MTQKQAAKILKAYNKWRKEGRLRPLHLFLPNVDAENLGEAIDIAVRKLTNK